MGYMVGKVCVAAVVLVIMAASRSTAQPPLPTGCMAELMPCMVNITATTMFCCTPLNDVLKNQLPCLCAVLNDPAGQLNLKTALDLFAGCNITGVSSNLCSADPALAPPPINPNLQQNPWTVMVSAPVIKKVKIGD
ncbi:non-specific lipid transfer protein GPI-anchored 9-like [Typha latifolia]|uniref:non-specific lipid transfer protein GPI-anchored 9-like n=1 Tax=Typha latifolia TaxID=4733 RepID=UPI003C2CE168